MHLGEQAAMPSRGRQSGGGKLGVTKSEQRHRWRGTALAQNCTTALTGEGGGELAALGVQACIGRAWPPPAIG